MALERVTELLRRAGLGALDPRVAIGVVCASVAVLGWAAWRWLPAGETMPFDEAIDVTQGSSEGTSTPESGAFVHVVGAVQRPGVYELPAGSRVRDAVDAAGGPLPPAALDGLNLARLVKDGEQIRVPTAEELAAQPAGAPAAAPPGSTAGAAGAVVDLNSADAALLDTLPGVGASTAEKIVADREANGPFTTVDDLLRVPGIGEKKLDGLRDLVTAG